MYPGGGGTPIYGLYGYVPLNRVCFLLLTLEQGIKIALSLWKRVYFISGVTLEQCRIFPRVLINYDQV